MFTISETIFDEEECDENEIMPNSEPLAKQSRKHKKAKSKTCSVKTTVQKSKDDSLYPTFQSRLLFPPVGRWYEEV